MQTEHFGWLRERRNRLSGLQEVHLALLRGQLIVGDRRAALVREAARTIRAKGVDALTLRAAGARREDHIVGSDFEESFPCELVVVDDDGC